MASDYRTKELVLLMLQFLKEVGYDAAARRLEMDSGFYFDMDYFEGIVLSGHWDEAEKYLSGFTKYDDNRFSTMIYFEIRKQNYIEALDKHDNAKALQILNRDLKVFASYKEELFKDMTQLLTLDNIRQNESLASYVDEKSARIIMLEELKKIIEANPLFKGKLKFPNMKTQRLRCLINQGLNWQLKHLQSKNTRQIETAFVDHASQSLIDLLSSSAENNFEELSTSTRIEDLLYGWPCPQTSSCKRDDLNDAADITDGGKGMKSNEVVRKGTESSQLDQREVTDLPKEVLWTFTEDSSPTSIDFHPTKPYILLVGMSNGDIGLWDVYWRKKLQSINFKVWNDKACSMAFTVDMVKDPHMSINRIAWSPDGSLFGAAYSTNMVQLFHYLWYDTIQQHKEIDAHIGAVNDLAFMVTNQKQLVLITCGDDLKIKVWDAESGANVFSLEGHTAPIDSICPYTNETDHFIFSTSLDGNIKLWMYDAFGVAGDYDAPVPGCTTIAYSSDGKRLFSYGTNVDGESFLAEWEFNEGAIKRVYKGLGQDCLDAIKFDTSKNKYLAVGDEHKIKFWDMDSTELLTTTDAAGNLPVRPFIRFNSEGTLLAIIAKEKQIKILVTDCSSDFITVRNSDGSKEFKPAINESRCNPEVAEKIDASSDESPKPDLASGKSEVLKSCGADSATRYVSLKIPSSLNSDKISRLIYTNAGDAIVALVAPTFVHMLWKWPEKATAKTSPISKIAAQLMRNQPSNIPPSEVFPCFALTKNDSYLLSASGGIISLFDIVNSRTILTFSETPPVATCIAFHPQDSNVIAIGMDDSTILIYHICLDKVKAKLVGHSGRVTGLAFSDSLNVLVSSGKDTQILVWEVEGWKMQRRISSRSDLVKLQKEKCDTYVQFHPDQTNFIVVSKTHIDLHNVVNPEYRRQVNLQGEITHARFSCDGQVVYVLFFDGSINVLDGLKLKKRYTIDRNSYLPEDMSRDVYPTAIAAHPQIPTQFAVGLANGEVFVVEPANEDLGQ